MPITSSAKKALRQSRRKEKINKPVKSKAKTLLKKARLEPSEESVKNAFSALDRAAKKNIIHKGKANRLKSRLAKLLTKKEK